MNQIQLSVTELPIEAFWRAVKAALLAGATVSGATAPTGINSPWWVRGDQVGGQPVFCNDAYVLYWEADTEYWVIATEVDGMALFTRDDPSPAGEYQPGAGSGQVTVSLPPVRCDEVEGNGEQLVLSQHSTVDSPEVGFLTERASFLLDFHHPARRVALLRAHGAAEYFRAYVGRSTSAPGFSFGGYTALFVAVDAYGVLDARKVTAGTKEQLLYRAAVDVTLTHITSGT